MNHPTQEEQNVTNNQDVEEPEIQRQNEERPSESSSTLHIETPEVVPQDMDHENPVQDLSPEEYAQNRVALALENQGERTGRKKDKSPRSVEE